MAAIGQTIRDLRLHENGIAILMVALVAIGIIYVGNYLSPSSYGIALERLDLSDRGLVYGTPRRVRSDEWAVLTPLMQASVNNGFTDKNTSSYYGEDMRMVFAMPIRDWGAIFKPQFAGFFILTPARAYSLYWYLCIAAFVMGYTLLLRRITGTFSFSLAATIAFLFTSGGQLWWTLSAPTLALFPLVILAFDNLRKSLWWAIPAFYLSTVWIIAFFYPPGIISLAFVGAVYFLAFRRDWFQPRIVVLSVGVAAAASAVAVLYLSGYITANLDTVYPGLRRSMGGSLPLQFYLGQFLPSLTLTYDYNNLIGPNSSEAATYGTWFILFLLCFMRYRSISKFCDSAIALAVLLGAAALMTLWMLAPVPSNVGAFLLWDRVPPLRMSAAFGLLCLFVVGFLYTRVEWTFAPQRIAQFCILPLGAWYYTKMLAGLDSVQDFVHDNIIVGLVLAALLATAYHPRWRLPACFYACSLAGFVMWAPFNPLQDSRAIFEAKNSPTVARLGTLIEPALFGKPALIATIFFGAVQNGLGLPSVSHVLTVPWSGWKSVFPEMLDEERHDLFDRFAHIRLREAGHKVSLVYADALVIPANSFRQHQLKYLNNAELIKERGPDTDDYGDGASFVERCVVTQSSNSANTSVEIDGRLHFTQADGLVKVKVFSKKMESLTSADVFFRPDLYVFLGWDVGPTGFSLQATGTQLGLNDPIRLLFEAESGKTIEIPANKCVASGSSG